MRTKFYDDEIKLDYSDVLVVPRMHDKNSMISMKGNMHIKQLGHKATPADEKVPLMSRNDVSLLRILKDDTYAIRVKDRKHGFTLKNKPMEYHDANGIFWCTPIIAANMDGVGTVKMGEALAKHQMLTALVKTVTDEELDKIEHPDNYFLTIGTSLTDLDRVEQFKHKFFKICIDTPNGYLESFYDTIEKVRKICGEETFIMAGNVVTPDAAIRAATAGADCVKIGIGPGSVCTTRLKTGVGFPQLSCIMDIKEAISNLQSYGGSFKEIFICADGGCQNPGDIVKALVAGADFVMLGGMLAGHTEGGGDGVVEISNTGQMTQTEDGNWVPVLKEDFKVNFYGMSSEIANNKHNGGLKGYKAAEGKQVQIPFKGDVEPTLQDIMGGIRSACTYLGCPTIEQLPEKGQFIRVNNQNNKVFG